MTIMSTCTSTQIPNQKTRKETDISRKQHSKQANLTHGKLCKVTQKINLCRHCYYIFVFALSRLEL